MSQIEDLSQSLTQYSDQLSMVTEALKTASSDERQSLIELQSELQELIKLTQESLEATAPSETPLEKSQQETEIDDEYALFMQEMAKSGAYDENTDKAETSNLSHDPEETNSDIEDDLSTLLGMKCAVYHTHKWGGQPSLHNAMVCAVVPRQDGDQFKDLQVNILFTHPTHAEMLPCPFYLDGECRFSNEQCRYSHGAAVQLSSLKDAIEPNFESIRVGSRVLLKLKPPDDEDISLTRKSSEKYHLWHRAVVKSVDLDNKTCSVRFEHGVKTGEKRKSSSDEVIVRFEDLFPLDVEDDADSDSGDSLSDTEYPENKCSRPESADRALLIERSLQNNAPSMGEWERHTRGIGSKLMLAMGYVPGTGLGASSDGRVAPVEARLLPVGKSLDHCMAITEKHGGQDALKVEQRLKRMQKKEEERNKRAYEREKEREKRDVFNILNKALGDKPEDVNATVSPITQIKQSTNKDLNIEQFKITEDTKKLEREILKLNSSLSRHSPGTGGFKTLNLQISEKTKELAILKSREQQISREQKQRKDKQKMTVF